MQNNVISFPVAEARYCAQCGEHSARLSYQNESFLYGVGEEQVVLNANVPVWSCESCEAQYTDGEAEDVRHAEICRHLGRLSPAEVRAVREKNALSQHDWSEVTGLGVASVKRWETGNLIQNESFDLYLRILAYPDVFAKLALVRRSVANSDRQSRFQTPISDEAVKSAASFVLRKAAR